MAKKIYVIAGEASGDLHGAHLIRSLRAASGPAPLEIYGVGGDRIRETGALQFFDLAHFHVTGVTDAIKRYSDYKKAANLILSRIAAVRPDVVVLIDNPGFNLHLAERIHALGIPVAYYIAPQIWAWAPRRVLKIKAFVRKVLVVFEFEKAIYEKNGVPVAWVGHPLKDLIPPREKDGAGGSPEKTAGLVVALMPGSRKGELKMLFSVFLEAAALLRREIPGISFRLIKAPTLPAECYRRLLGNSPVPVDLVENDSYDAIRSCDLALVCSGTATLECAMLGTPMIIANRGTWLTYLAARILIRVPCLGLPNLILGQKKFPELLQFDATGEKIAAEALKILRDPSVTSRMKKDLEEVSRRLGESGAGQRAAEEILRVIG
ncbi:MAG: lipid-A-disaccharide synthase [Candidatus Omnitrophica bacterium]|nr:lipid-A-disaccharide synthase [Candidatus Omnitrophota bacterium]